MDLPRTIGQQISDLCNGNHITQKELAEKIGVSTVNVCKSYYISELGLSEGAARGL